VCPLCLGSGNGFLTKRQCCLSVKDDKRVKVGKASVEQFQEWESSSNVMNLNPLELGKRTTLVLEKYKRTR